MRGVSFSSFPHASVSRLSFSRINITVIVFDTFASVVIGKELHTISSIFNTRFYCVGGNILSGK